MNSNEQEEAWYRQFWPWFIMVPPATAIVACSITIWLSLTNAPDLVVPDYAKIDETIALNFRLNETATDLGLQAKVHLDQLDGSDNRSVSLQITQNPNNNALSDQVLLRLVHPTLPKFDRSVLLVKDGERYRGAVDLPAAKYTLQIEDLNTSWRLTAEITNRSTTVVIGQP
jgi:hypothetical protein